MAMLAICFVPIAESDAAYKNIDGDSVIGVDKKAEYDITYSNHDFDDKEDMSMSISYSAKFVDSTGSTVSNGVSPSSGSLDNGVSKTLTVSAPKTTGTYTLEVEYTADVTYTEDEETKTEEVKDTETFTIKVVTPITLKITLKNDSAIDLSGFGVYFYVNGEKIEDSYTTVDLATKGTTTVSYEWITDSGRGEYKYHVEAADSGTLVSIEGLGDEHTFYIGDNDYSVIIALLVIVIVLLALVMVWIYRKPVKNYGKPKSRR